MDKIDIVKVVKSYHGQRGPTKHTETVSNETKEALRQAWRALQARGLVYENIDSTDYKFFVNDHQDLTVEQIKRGQKYFKGFKDFFKVALFRDACIEKKEKRHPSHNLLPSPKYEKGSKEGNSYLEFKKSKLKL